VDNRDRDRWQTDRHTLLYAPSFDSDSRLAYVFGQEMSQVLISELLGLGFVTHRGDDPRWIGMRPELARLYMTSLAEAMVPGLGAHPLADTAFDHVAVSGLTMERLAAALVSVIEPSKAPPAAPRRDDREVEQAMASVAFRLVGLKHPEAVPAEKIIEFRNAYAEERDRLQAEVAQLTASLAHLKEVNARELEDQLTEVYDKKLAPPLKRLREGLHKANIDTIPSSMASSFPLPAGVAALLAATGITPAAPLVVLGGLAFTAWTILRKRKEAVTEVLRPSSAAYLHQASRYFKPETVTRRIYEQARRFLP
jgi:hypothetical protein